MSFIPASSTGVIAVVVSVLVLYQLGCVIYNLYRHPLRKYPGPRLAAVSQMPIIFATITGKSPFWLHKMHLKYGPVVRVAPNELSYTDYRACKDIYGIAPSRPYGMPRDSGVFEYMEDEENRPSLLTASDSEHSRIRRAYAPAFSLKALAAQEPMLTKYANDFLSILHGLGVKEKVDIVRLYHTTIFDMMGHLQYGESLGILENRSHKSWADSSGILPKVATVLAALSDLPWFKLLLVRVVLKGTRSARQGYFAPSNERINRRLALAMDGNSTPDLVGLAFQSSRKNGLTERDVRANAHLIMTGGTETTTSLLASLTAFLLASPDALTRVKNEVRTAFNECPDLTMTGAARLPYLNACINEALRIRSPISGSLGRLVPRDGAMIAGRWVPQGTRVYSNPLATMRSPDNFRDPDRFIPDRWLEGSSLVFENDKKAAFHPFSMGRRDCIGQDLAYAMARLIFCKLIVNFDLRSASDLEQWCGYERVWTSYVDPPLYVDLIPLGSGGSA